MGRRPRRNHTPAFKARAALAASSLAADSSSSSEFTCLFVISSGCSERRTREDFTTGGHAREANREELQ